MSTSRASRKIANQYNKPQLKIHKIVSAAIELGCTNEVGVNRSLLIEHLAHKYGDSERVWAKRLAQTFSEDNKEYGQYFCKIDDQNGDKIIFYPSVWEAILRVDWKTEDVIKATEIKPETVEVEEKEFENMDGSFSGKKGNSLQLVSWGIFSLEIIGSSTPDKNHADFFRADVAVARLNKAVESGASFLFVFVYKNSTKSFAIPAHTLMEACRDHHVSANSKGTPRYELYINHKKGIICKNMGINGKIATFLR